MIILEFAAWMKRRENNSGILRGTYHLDSAVRQNATSNSRVLNNNTLVWQQKPLFCT